MIALRKVKGSQTSLELSSGVNVSTSLVPAYGSSEKSDPLAADEKSGITNVSRIHPLGQMDIGPISCQSIQVFFWFFF